jgi:hypothetical protein
MRAKKMELIFENREGMIPKNSPEIHGSKRRPIKWTCNPMG